MGAFAREFTRTTWSSAAAQQVWQPRIQAAAKAWMEVEVLSVMSGYRQAALVFGREIADQFKLPVVQVGPNRFAVGPMQMELKQAMEDRDDDTVGRLLRFPACCRNFFDQTWGAGMQDTTWEMAHTTGHEVTVSGPVEANILGRWLGIRWVPHLPCSFMCNATVRAGEVYRDLMRELSPEYAKVVDEVLNWPVEWSALHGLAEIKHPVVKAISRTTYTARKFTVRRNGTMYPAEGARGIAFPYRVDIPQPMKFIRPSHAVNGFSSAKAMDAAHAMVMQAVAAGPVERLIDLGCGNGLLMDKLFHMLNVPVEGIEADASKASGDDRIIVGDLRYIARLTVNMPIDTVVVSVNRFREIPELEQWCRTRARRTVVYSYDEPQFARDLDGGAK